MRTKNDAQKGPMMARQEKSFDQQYDRNYKQEFVWYNDQVTHQFKTRDSTEAHIKSWFFSARIYVCAIFVSVNDMYTTKLMGWNWGTKVKTTTVLCSWFLHELQVDFFRRQKALLTTDNYREQREKAEAKRSCSHGAINAYYAAKNVGLSKQQQSST